MAGILTAVYIDGFNLYNGLARPLGCKWVNLSQYFETLFPDATIEVIYFFTAKVSGPRINNQNKYIAALGTLPSVKVIEGHFKRKRVSCRVSTCPLGCEEMACAVACGAATCHCGERLTKRPAGRGSFKTFEEKHTDVNIALQMLEDAYISNIERMVVVSGDSDLVPAINRVKAHPRPIDVVLCVPCLGPNDSRGAAGELRESVDRSVPMMPQDFIAAQFPATISKANGKKLVMPDDWDLARPEAEAEALSALAARNAT